jgi:hypothetical protein
MNSLVQIAALACVGLSITTCAPSIKEPRYTKENLPRADRLAFIVAAPGPLEKGGLGTLRLLLKNVGTVTIVANCAFRVNSETFVPENGDIYFKVTHPSRLTGPFRNFVKFAPLEAEDFIRLQPGESCEGHEYLLEDYALEVGEYKLVGRYCNQERGEDFGVSAEIGCADADPIAVKITGSD